MKCYVDKPYPDVKVERKNKEYAYILMHAYAGKISEETATHQYICQHFLLEEPFKKILKEISIVEMHHLELLGETIHLLGVEPKYEIQMVNGDTIFWTSAYVPYANTVKEMIELDIRSEMSAIENYKKDIAVIKDIHIQALLSRIIEDEELHLQIFHELLSKLVKD